MKKIALISLMISMIGVSCTGQGGFTENDKVQIQEVMANHEKTLIYIWAEYCQASKNMFEANIKPYLEGLANNNVGIVIVYYGKEEAVSNLASNNRLIVTSDIQIPLLVKRDANKTMKKMLKNYKKSNGMPIPLLVDKNGFVLNYEEDGDLSYLEVFKAAESLNSD